MLIQTKILMDTYKLNRLVLEEHYQKQEQLIKHNREIMEGNLITKDYFFEKFHTLFSMKFDKPGKIELYIAENLKINNQGILEIKDEIITVINNYKIYFDLNNKLNYVFGIHVFVVFISLNV